MFNQSIGQHWQGRELAEECRLVLQLASVTAPDADRDLLVFWASVFGTPRTGRGAKLVRCKQSPQAIRSAVARLWRRRQHVADRSAAAGDAEPGSATDQALIQAAAEAA
jgi:hypothetical protein